jgi:NitT/TauT family transport system permease protein
MTEASSLRRVWAALLPPAIAVALVLAAWQLVAWSGWRPDYVLPPPGPVLAQLGHELRSGAVFEAVAITMRRAIVGYSVAVVIGTALGLLLARTRLLRRAVGSLATGLQTMPSVAWFPLAILLFQLGEGAIVFVVVLGAAPSVTTGLLSSFDHVPPTLVRAGRVLGARGFGLYRHVVLPAALPGFVAGLQQGWAFAWRSLMAGELLVIVGHQPSLGVRLQFARELSDAVGLLAWMIVILAIGMFVDLAVFGRIQATLRRRRGLLDSGG